MRTLRSIATVAAAALLPIVLLACTPTRPQPQGAPPLVRGRGTIVELNVPLGYGVLDMNGFKQNFYWRTEIAMASPGAVNPPANIFQAPVGVAQEPNVIHTVFPAHVGDIIEFLGLRNGPDILIQHLAIIGHAP